MTPTQLIAEFNSVCAMAVPHHRDANAGAIAAKVYELGPQILAALSACEGASRVLGNIERLAKQTMSFTDLDADDMRDAFDAIASDARSAIAQLQKVMG